MPSPSNLQHSLAVLIDADNARATVIDELLAEVAKFGAASVKRIYGDWTTPQLGAWKGVLLEHSIQPIQQFRYTVGKNATDSAMIIDAMDLLYTDRFDGFCLVSSDSDFTRLASRIREAGKQVYGFGEKKTPRPFVAACDKFIYTEVLVTEPDSPTGSSRKTTKELRGDSQLVNLLRGAVDAVSDDDGWSDLGAIGNHIANQSPDFDPRNYGFKKLSDVVKAIGLFDVDRQKKGIMIRDNRKRA